MPASFRADFTPSSARRPLGSYRRFHAPLSRPSRRSGPSDSRAPAPGKTSLARPQRRGVRSSATQATSRHFEAPHAPRQPRRRNTAKSPAPAAQQPNSGLSDSRKFPGPVDHGGVMGSSSVACLPAQPSGAERASKNTLPLSLPNRATDRSARPSREQGYAHAASPRLRQRAQGPRRPVSPSRNGRLCASGNPSRGQGRPLSW